ncbi:hypothetical protein C0Q70_21129 [Pomacea canaliculata]|uniref:Major facilitator superfamily (MFS) profile domain-containing protein n=1 Tax=Pomacea canaliculata TaxID=400727 RepID=A0A2T7NBP2_POMCA|nr:hypothetical protein C0Q70_21129 [Pomacea canaliculata]
MDKTENRIFSTTMVNLDDRTATRGAVEGDGRRPGPKSHVAPDTRGLPVDRGYAWVIAFSCMFCNAVCMGLQRGIAILFVEFIFMFQKSASETSLIFSLQTGAMSVAYGPGVFSGRASAGLRGRPHWRCGLDPQLLRPESVHVVHHISLFGGIALSLIINPTLVIINMYFNKRRSLATSISALGGNMGAMVFPIYTQTLISELGAHGAMLVLGATYLNVLVGGMLLRPFHLNKRKTMKDEEAMALTRAEDDGEALDTESVCKTPGAGQTTAYSRQQSVTATSSDSQHSLAVARALSAPELTVMPPELTYRYQSDSRDTEGEEFPVDKQEADDSFLYEHSPERNVVRKETQILNNSELSKAPSQSMEASGSKERKPCEKVLAIFDISLFKLPLFWLVIVSSCFSSIGMVMNIYIPSLAEEKGISSQDAAILLTIIGACGMTSRLLIGYLADLAAILIGACSVVGMFTPFYTSFTSLVVFSALYGVFGPVFFSICPVVIVDLLGLENLGPTLGFVTLFQAAAEGASHALTGHVTCFSGKDSCLSSRNRVTN